MLTPSEYGPQEETARSNMISESSAEVIKLSEHWRRVAWNDKGAKLTAEPFPTATMAPF